jgi:hypothetical protein
VPLRDTLERIPTAYQPAKSKLLEAHPLAAFIRNEAAQAANTDLGDLGRGLIVEESPGQGTSAAVPCKEDR